MAHSEAGSLESKEVFQETDGGLSDHRGNFEEAPTGQIWVIQASK